MASADELAASENRLRVLLGCTKGIVFEFDREGRYLAVWTHDEDLLARPTDEMLGRTINEVLGEVGQRFTEAVRRVHDSGRAETIEYDLVVQGGKRWFVADVIVSPEVVGRDRTIVYLVRDITTHKQLEERLGQAQKLEAIGQLAGGVAHDFNNILTTIIGYSDMLLADLEKASTHRKHATRIRLAAGRAAAITKQLLAYGQKRVLVPESVDINAEISSTSELLRQLMGPHIDLRLDLTPQMGGARVDRTGLEQILMNLSLNARDALGSGGTLTLRTEMVTLDDTYCAEHVDLVPGAYILISATDDGVGMDEATKARIFEPFFTTKAGGKGTGLGLATVHGIVKQSRGHIEVQSSPGAGASFRIYLPHVAVAPATNEVTSPPVEPAARMRGTILVVDDDGDVRELIDNNLRSAGHVVLLAPDGSRALELARQHAIDLLVTDIVMPKLRGDELARRVRQLQPEVRVLYISGYPVAAHGATAIDLGESELLAKPFTREALIEAAAATLDR